MFEARPHCSTDQRPAPFHGCVIFFYAQETAPIFRRINGVDVWAVSMHGLLHGKGYSLPSWAAQMARNCPSGGGSQPRRPSGRDATGPHSSDRPQPEATPSGGLATPVGRGHLEPSDWCTGSEKAGVCPGTHSVAQAGL